jgi:hypothetical protein
MGSFIDRRGFLCNVTLAGAAALAPQAARAQAAESTTLAQLAQGDTGATLSARAITVKSSSVKNPQGIERRGRFGVLQ